MLAVVFLLYIAIFLALVSWRVYPCLFYVDRILLLLLVLVYVFTNLLVRCGHESQKPLSIPSHQVDMTEKSSTM